MFLKAAVDIYRKSGPPARKACIDLCSRRASTGVLQSVSDAGNDAEAPPELLLFAMPGPRGLAQKRARNGRVFGAMSNDQIDAIRICRCVQLRH